MRRASPRPRSTLLEDANARAGDDRARRAAPSPRMGGALPRTLAELERLSCRRRRHCSMRLKAPFWWYRKQGVLAAALAPLGRLYGSAAEARFAKRRALPLAAAGDLHRQFHRGRRRQDADRDRRRRAARRTWRASPLSSPGAMAEQARGRCCVKGSERGRCRRRAAAAGGAGADLGLGRPRGRRASHRGEARRERHRHG